MLEIPGPTGVIRSPRQQPRRSGGRRTPALAGGPAGAECRTPSASAPPPGRTCHTSLRCGSICREPKSSGASAEAVTVEKFATEARAVTVFAKMASSPSLKDRIINFPIFPHLLIFARIIYNHLFDLALYRPISHRYTSSNEPRLMLYILRFST